MSENQPMRVKIFRRRKGRPQRTTEGIFTFISVTYATTTLSPEIIKFTEQVHTPEREIEEITKRIRTRLNMPEQQQFEIELIE